MKTKFDKRFQWDESDDWSKPKRKRVKAKCPFCRAHMNIDRRVMTCTKCGTELPIQREA